MGWNGRNHNANVFINLLICETMDAGLFVPDQPTLEIGGVTIPPLILGDGAHLLRQWLMKPYGDRRHSTIDRKLSSARCIMERAFECWKARWWCLTSGQPVAMHNMTAVISSCVILHNICDEQTTSFIRAFNPNLWAPHPATSTTHGSSYTKENKGDGSC